MPKKFKDVSFLETFKNAQREWFAAELSKNMEYNQQLWAVLGLVEHSQPIGRGYLYEGVRAPEGANPDIARLFLFGWYYHELLKEDKSLQKMLNHFYQTKGDSGKYLYEEFLDAKKTEHKQMDVLFELFDAMESAYTGRKFKAGEVVVYHTPSNSQALVKEWDKSLLAQANSSMFKGEKRRLR